MKLKYLNFLLVLILFVSCSTPQKDYITLTLNVENPDPEVNYTVRLTSSFTEDPFIRFKLSPESPSKTLTIPFKSERMFLLTGDFFKSIYAEPGDDLTINVTRKGEEDFDFTYEGSASEPQRLLDQLREIEQSLTLAYQENENGINDLNEQEFFSLLSKIKSEKSTTLKSANIKSEAFNVIIEAEIWAQDIMLKQNFKNHQNYVVMQEGEEEMVIAEVDERYKTIMTFDERALGSESVLLMMGSYVIDVGMEGLNYPFWEAQEIFPDMYFEVDKDSTLSKAFKGQALKSFLSNIILYANIDQIGHLKDDFEVKYQDTPEYEFVIAEYNKWEPLRKGKPAIDFTYENHKGETVSLSDFKGKVVFIDVWATWCSPCIAEFPHSKEIKNRLGEAEDVVWLYVSVDVPDKKDQWLTDLEKHGLADNINLFGDNGWGSTIMKDYNILGIPRYILIDKEGTIFSSNAPKPSNRDMLFNQIQELRAL